MAYNRRYNPDALPAHVEPQQAAQYMSSRPPPAPSRQDSYATKPPPPPPAQASRYQQDDRYARTSSSQDYRSPTTGRAPGGGFDNHRQPNNPRYDSYDSYEERGPRPNAQGMSRPPPGQTSARPPPTPALPKDASERDELWPMFRAVDKQRTGQLSEHELGAALVNGDYTSFDPHTVKMMIRMFDVDRSGTISFDEFCGLWAFLSEWRKLFDRFDVDRSGNISYDEFSSALAAFGYRLSPDYVSLLFNTYDARGRGALSFDLFVQSCISLKRMTDVFKRYDTDRDGYITLSFEQFLTGSQSLFLFNSISPSTDREGAY